MTTREQVVAAAKLVDPSINKTTVDFADEDDMKKLEHFYSIAFEAGAASRDVEMRIHNAILYGTSHPEMYKSALDYCKEENDKLRAELTAKTAESNRRLDLMNTLDAELEASRTREGAALAACKVKDEALIIMRDNYFMHAPHEQAVEEALAIQPNDATLKAWLGEPACFVTPDGEGWRMRFDPPVSSVPLGWTPLYSPKELK